MSAVRFTQSCFSEITNGAWTSVDVVLLTATSTPPISTGVIVLPLSSPNPWLKGFLFCCDYTWKTWFKFLVVVTVLPTVFLYAAVGNWQSPLEVTNKSVNNEFKLNRESSDTLLPAVNSDNNELGGNGNSSPSTDIHFGAC